MPRNTREWAHRKISQVDNNLSWGLMHLEDVDKVYKDQHPEISEVIIIAQTMIVQTQDLLKKLVQSF